MLPYRLHTESGVIIVEFISLGLSEGPELDNVALHLKEELMRSPGKRMVLDCSRLKFMASRGLGVIVELGRLAEQHKGGLAVCGLSAQLSQSFRFAGISRFITVTSGRQDAVAAVKAVETAV